MSLDVLRCPEAGAVASFLDMPVDTLAEGDKSIQLLGRWLAKDGGTAVGLATAFVRPDDRLFVTHRLTAESAFGPLLDAAIDDLDHDIHLTIEDSDEPRMHVAERAGFIPEFRAVSYAVPFQPALAATQRLHSRRIDVVPADAVDPDMLFRLDTELRQDVPGSDGWRGNRAWFDDEMRSAEYDPAAYPVARDHSTGALIGLCRIWKSDAGPKLGMIGVRPSHRTGAPAVRLLNVALSAASRWGSPTFQTHTARPPLQRRLQTLGARETGGFLRLKRLAEPPAPATGRSVGRAP